MFGLVSRRTVTSAKRKFTISFFAGEDFCHTLHIVDSRGQSVLVNKKCAEASECDPAVLGCLHIDTQTV